MEIPEKFHEEIRNIDVNSHKVKCEFSNWKARFEENENVLSQINVLENFLSSEFGRSELVNFYKTKHGMETKFLATMIWGHEAPANSRRDTRGPWKVSEMFASLKDSPDLLESISIDSEEDLKKSYIALNKGIKRCGPNFFSKHLYFLGKSKDKSVYPLIFDDRVAVGLAKLSLQDKSCTDLVSIHAKAKPDAYLKYLRFSHGQAIKINCDPDQIEYFLFKNVDRA